MIKVEQLVKEYGNHCVVDHLSFEVEKGTVLGFLGPNGAGKTTTIRMLAGYLQPTSGHAYIGGIDASLDPVGAQHQTGYMPENTPLYDDMTVKEFLHFAADVRGLAADVRPGRVQEIMQQCYLMPVASQVIETLSKGYRQRTCMAQALLHDPEVLLLDEPTEGLDPNQKVIVRDMIREMAKQKVILISTHVLEEVEAICSRVIIISAGRIVADDTPEALKQKSNSGRLEDVFRELTVTDDSRRPAEEVV